MRATPADAQALALKCFLNGQRIDLQTLAAELGISRITLYRWVGTHDMLMGEVLGALADVAWAEAQKKFRRSSPEYAARVIHQFLVRIQEFGPFRIFLKADPEYALKVLTSKHSPVQERVILHVRALLEAQAQAGRLALPKDVHSLSYALVRICESFLYNDFITGRDPDLGKAREIVSALLQAPWKRLEL
jgi:AcrR family transcriptional regulator